MLVEVCTLNQADRWRQLANAAGGGDVYFSPEYASCFGTVSPGRSLLFSCRKEESLFAYPFRLRSLATQPGLEDFQDWYDISSDYGYGGPLVSTPSPCDSAGFVARSFEQFDRWCQENAVVSEFCRFHPLLDNATTTGEILQPAFCNQTVWVDLKQSEAELLAQLRKSHRYDIRRAEREGVQITQGTAPEQLQSFYSIYSETMNAVGATAYYFFGRDFFERKIRFLAGRVEIFLARLNGEAVAASMFLLGDQCAHYHFSGTSRTAGRLSPNKLLLFKALLWARRKGLTAMHLGGGVSGSDSDSLMRFKTGFSSLRAEFHIGKRIHNADIYAQACAARSVERVQAVYFPAYRMEVAAVDG